MTESVRKILHLDLDAFYPSVEKLDNPEIVDKPVIVGGIGPRGVVASACYLARRFKVHSALPTAVALRRCPGGVYLRPRFDRYRELSTEIFSIYREWTERVQPLSMDEAFLDVSNHEASGEAIAGRIRQQVLDATGLTVSAGVAHNKFLAKLASDHEKPDGLTVIPENGAIEWLAPLPVRRLWGVGPATAAKLEEAGVHTIGDIDKVEDGFLRGVVGNLAERLKRLSMGLDDREVSPPGRPRSISAETTFERDIRSWKAAAPHVQRFAERVAAGLERRDLVARTVVLKVRYGDFHTITRSSTPSVPVASRDEILAVARELARRAERPPTAGIRLIGLGVQNLLDLVEVGEESGATTPDQLDLF